MKLLNQSQAEIELRHRRIPLEVYKHRDTFTAKGEARALGLSLEQVLKVVVLHLVDDYLIAVVPASRLVDMDLVMKLVRDPRIRLATEAEIVARFPDFDLGAVPPLPDELEVRALVDPSVFLQDEVAFADGKQDESIVANPRAIFWGQNVIVAPISREPDLWGPWHVVEDSIDL